MHDDVRRRFDRLQREAQREVRRRTRAEQRASKKKPIRPTRGLARVLAAVIAAFLPFVVLVRATLAVDQQAGLPPWPALVFGTIVTAGLLMLYAMGVAGKLTGRFRLSGFVVKMLVGVVTGYVIFGLVTISATHLKNERLRPYYRTLHPALRLAVATATLTDDDLLLTDLARQPGDYVRMGLPINDASLHFEQDDGYVHALDVRTTGRAEWKNRLTMLYFGAMGFTTLRHVGTADHLHIALPRR